MIFVSFVGFKQLTSPAAVREETPAGNDCQTHKMKGKVIFWEGSKSNFALRGERVRNQKTWGITNLERRAEVSGTGRGEQEEEKKKLLEPGER